MKKIIPAIIFALSVLFFGCKKTDVSDEPSLIQLDNPASKQVIDNIKTWLNQQPENAKKFIAFVDGNMIKIDKEFLWNETEYFPETKIAITPVLIKGLKKAPKFKYLATKFKDDGSAGVGFYFDILGKDNGQAIHRNLITPEFISYKSIPITFSGAIIMYDMYEGLIMANNYEKGILKDKNDKMELKKGAKITADDDPVKNNAPLDDGCSYVTLEWFWQTYVNGVLVDEIYVGSSQELFCIGGGGGYGGSQSCQEQFDYVVNNGTAISNGPSSSSFNSADPSLTRNIPYNWYVYHNFAYGIISYEMGTVERITYPNITRWEYTNMVHSSMKSYGARTYTCIDESCVDDCHFASFTPNISPTKMKCETRLDYKVSFKKICNGTTLSVTDKPGSSEKTWWAPNVIIIIPAQ